MVYFGARMTVSQTHFGLVRNEVYWKTIYDTNLENLINMWIIYKKDAKFIQKFTEYYFIIWCPKYRVIMYAKKIQFSLSTSIKVNEPKLYRGSKHYHEVLDLYFNQSSDRLQWLKKTAMTECLYWASITFKRSHQS